MITANSLTGRLSYGTFNVPFSFGRGGVIDAKDKIEGDGCSPLGSWFMRQVLYRPDRLNTPPLTHGLSVTPLSLNDLWCDDPNHGDYNLHVTSPHPASCENLWRDDHIYDVIVPLGYNDDPVVSGKGSAIFLHVAHPNYTPTRGCIALALPYLLFILRTIGAENTVTICNND